MPSPKLAAQPNPSYPALCRQDTTSPWSTNNGGNIFCKTLIQMLEAACIQKKGKDETQFQERQKNDQKK